MTAGQLPEQIVQFVRVHINSVEQLETLLLLYRHPDRDWTATDVSDELRTGPDSAASRLEDLEKRRLVAASRTSSPTYRYAPADASLHAAVAALAAAYEERRYTIIDLIFSKPLDKIRVFANAFRLRPEDDDDG